jgi:hypothetical protein
MCFQRKASHSWVEKFSQGRSKVAGRRTRKAMGHVYQCWWRICREINVLFQIRISNSLRLISMWPIY